MLTLTETLTHHRWQAQNPDACRLRKIGREDQIEYLDMLSWEIQQNSAVKTKLCSVWFQGCWFSMKGICKSWHPTVETLCFQDCVFGIGSTLDQYPRLKRVYFSNCSGEITIRDNNLDLVACATQYDRDIITLQNTSVSSF